MNVTRPDQFVISVELPQTQTISTVHKGLKDGNAPGTLSRKRTRSESSSSELFSTRKKSKKNKGKEKGKSQEVVDPNAGVKKMLAEFEDELTCPMCAPPRFASRILLGLILTPYADVVIFCSSPLRFNQGQNSID